jgi:HSP20 family protein
MMLPVKWESPFRDLLGVEDDVARLFGRAPSRTGWIPPLDVRETDDRFEVTVDLPGMEAGDVSVSFEDGVLTVSGKRELSSEHQGDTYHRIERSYGSFARSIRLPRTADAEKIDATFDKG